MCLNKTFFFISFTFGVIYCLEVIPERAVATYLNDKYLQNVTFTVKRYSRKSPYYLNVAGTLKHTWANNVSLHLLFYEFLHNEYRRSFVEFHFKVCDLINSEPYVGGMIANQGIICPAKPKHYMLYNMTVPSKNFPHVWPFEKCRVDVFINITKTGESIAVGYAIVAFKKLKRNKKK